LCKSLLLRVRRGSYVLIKAVQQLVQQNFQIAGLVAFLRTNSPPTTFGVNTGRTRTTDRYNAWLRTNGMRLKIPCRCGLTLLPPSHEASDFSSSGTSPRPRSSKRSTRGRHPPQIKSATDH
jgi:hypothetical protein